MVILAFVVFEKGYLKEITTHSRGKSNARIKHFVANVTMISWNNGLYQGTDLKKGPNKSEL